MKVLRVAWTLADLDGAVVPPASTFNWPSLQDHGDDMTGDQFSQKR
ncbi:hypothetical protein QJS66_01155 [Kocuria rhizophila]|nr:hypothetical protein QJS66_01155 [Kocuria rhizophila]